MLTARGGLSAQQIDAAYDAAQVVVRTHQRVSEWLRIGVTLPKIDEMVRDTLAAIGAASCFHMYRPARRIPPFPSYSCLSVNDCVVHGTAASLRRPLQAGDVLKIDIGCKFKGWIGDAGWTYCFGKPTPLAAKLMQSGKDSLAAGIAQMRPGVQLMEFARAVQGIVEQRDGFHLVRGLGGHGLFDPKAGKPALHGPPFVANRLPESGESWSEGKSTWQPGMLVAVEPMIAAGTGELADKEGDADAWPERSADGSLTVHYEHDVLITPDGPRILTEGMERLRDIIE